MAENRVNEKEIQNIRITEGVKKFVVDLVNDVMQDDKNRQPYLDDLLIAYNQRMMNPDNDNVPWIGATNISVPFTDKIIRKKKPVLVNSIWNTRKLAVVNVAEGTKDPRNFEDKAERTERGLNLYLRKRIKWLDMLILGVDYMLEKGRSYFKVYEEFNFKFVNRKIDINDLKDRSIDLGGGQIILFDEDFIKQARTLEDSELIEILERFAGFDLNIEDDDHLKIAKEVVKEFKSGKDVIEYQLPIIESKPVILAIPPEDIIVPIDTPRDLQKARRITHQYQMTEKELLDAANSKMFNKTVVENKLNQNRRNESRDSKRRQIELKKELDRGLTEDRRAGVYDIWEIHTYWKAPSSKRLEKWVFTVFANENNGEILRVIKEPNDEDIFPFEALDHEIIDDNAYASRGIPKMLRHVQQVIDMQENNRINRDILNNTPMFRNEGANSGITSSLIQFIPGQVLDKGIIPFNLAGSNVDVSSERIEATLLNYGEQYVGTVDFAIAAGTVKGTGRAARTLGEIQIAQSEAAKIANLDFVTFNEGVTRLYEMVFQVLKERIGENLFLDGQILNKSDFNFPVEVKSNGSLEESDQQIKINKALNRMQIINQQPVEFATVEDRYNAFIDYLEADGVKDIEKYSTNPLEVGQTQLLQLQQQTQQVQQQLLVLNKALEDAEKNLSKTEEKQRQVENKFKGKMEAKKETASNLRDKLTNRSNTR